MNTVLPAFTYEFMLTRKCNMNCSYCFEKDKSGTSDADLDKIYDMLINGGLYSDQACSKFYMFGGEPLLNVEFLDKLSQKIQDNKNLSESAKKKYIESIFSNITTNGTLIDKAMPILKKYNASLQISLDGPEDVNDACRVDYNGKGHFQQIMDNIKLCQENEIRYCLHGAVAACNYKNFARIVRWFVEMQLENPNKFPIEQLLFHNYLQLVFEDNISDEDIDTLLQQYQEVVETLLYSDLLKDYTPKQRADCACGFLARHGGRCSAANNMYAFDNDMYIYPCHRLMTSGMEKYTHEFALGKLGSSEHWNYKLYEQFLDAPNKGILYGPVFDYITFDDDRYNFMANWCPSTNLECTGNTNTYPCKHDVLLAELQKFIPKLAEYYGLDLDDYRKRFKGKN